MTLAIDYNGAPIGYDVPPTKVAMPQRAELGAISMGSISPEDPTAALTLVGHKPIAITESACSQQRLFTGWTVERNMGRSFEQSQFVGADPLIHDTTIVDLNAAFGFRIITWTDGKRPEESVDDRLAWLLASNYLAGPDGELVGDTGKVKTGFTLMMDAVDYRGSYPSDVLADLSQRYATPINYFAYWDFAPVTGHGVARPGLFFDYISEGTFDCTISISNLIADTYTGDVPKTTCFAPITESRLERTPEAVYSDVIVNYANGSIYRYLNATATAFIKRGTSISRPYTGKSSTATMQADAWLAAHNVETDRITTTIHVPAAQVGLIQAGMRMDVKFSHLTDYTSFTSMRIVACTPRPMDDLARFYDVDLELVAPKVAPQVPLYIALLAAAEGAYGCGPDIVNPDGSIVIGWGADGDVPPVGWGAEVSSGPVEYVVYRVGSRCLWRGVRITADALVDIHHVGGFGGVRARWLDATCIIQIRQNGVVISDQTYTEPADAPSGYAPFYGGFTFALTDIVVAAGDEFEMSVVFIPSDLAFAYYAAIPSDTNATSHFRVSGNGAWGPTGGGTVGPPLGSTITGETPTPAPDGSTVLFTLANSYLTGTLWVSVDGIPIPASEVTETNPAGVSPTWQGTFTLSWAPDADEQILVTYQVG